ncbi:MAG: 2-oxo acid dehydrogenase subunit E2 [Proteobacteria bacterium]|nr:2-oxo acid dehydrogenase subunit E2 [Pseudomonadota bacterium]
MAAEINIPKLGMSMKEASLVEWKFNEGDQVNKGDIVLIIETEKTSWEVESLGSGLLHILVPITPDAKEEVGAVVGQLAENEDELKTLQEQTGVAATPAAAPKADAGKKAAPAAKSGKGGRLRASPVAKKLAQEQGIDLTTVAGSGPGGRITKEDVERAIEAKKSAPADAAPTGEMVDGKEVLDTISLKSGMRKAIASHMRNSLAISAQLTTMGEIDMTEVKKLRAQLLEQEDMLGVRITYTDIFIVAITKALKAIPIVNSSLIDDEIKLWKDISIGVAVAIDDSVIVGGGLIVPVVKHTDKKTLPEISKELKGLVKDTREGKILPDNLSGNTFTITNLGGAGGGYGFGTPIINQPDSAIMGTGPITDRPVVRDGEIVIRPILTYSFTFDHRVIDGAPAGMFMAHLTQLLENPALMIV